MSKKGADDGVKTIVIAAAGNDESDDEFYPAAYDWVIGVGSVDIDGKRVRLLQLWQVGERLRARTRPGQRVLRGDLHLPLPREHAERRGRRTEFDGLARWSGTSFATPMVTGAIAAHMSATGNLTDPMRAYNELLQAAQTGPGGEKIIGPL